MTFLGSKSGRKNKQKETLNRTSLVWWGDRGGKGETEQEIRRRMRMDRSMGSEVSGSMQLGVLQTVAAP